MQLSPQFGQIWDFLPSSSITYNIYRPLKGQSRGQQQGSTSNHQHQPSGFVIVDLMDLCDAEEFSIMLLWDETLAGVKSLLARPGKGRGPGLSWDSTSRQTTLMFLCPLVQATTNSFIPGAEKVSLSSCSDYCEVRSAARHCCPCSQLPTDSDRAYCIHAFSVNTAAGEEGGGGGTGPMWGILIKASSAWSVLAERQRNRGLTLALFVILSSISHTVGVTMIHDDTWL